MLRKFTNVLRYLRPTPLDAWVLATALLWSAATICSVLAYVDNDYFDLVVLKLPVAVGTAAITLAILVRSCFVKISARLLLLHLLSVLVTVALLGLSGRWIDVSMPTAFDGIDSYQMPRAPFGYLGLFGGLATWVLVSALVCFVGVSAIRRVSLSLSWPKRAFLSLWRHRVRWMIGFVVVMFPAVVLRNVLDPDNHSLPFLIWMVEVVVVKVAAILLATLTLKLLSGRRTVACILFASAVLFAAICVGGSLIDECFKYQKRLAFALATGGFYAWFSLAFVSTFGDSRRWDSEAESQQPSRRMSVWTMIVPLIFLAAGTILWNRYDPRVLANLPGQYRANSSYIFDGQLLADARASRQLQAELDKTSCFLMGSRQRSGSLYFRVDERHPDPDCLAKLMRARPAALRKQSASILIDNLQPFVDTRPLTAFTGWLSFYQGQITSTQLADLGKRVGKPGTPTSPRVGFSKSKLPAVNEPQAQLQRAWVSQAKGLPQFLDAYAGVSLQHIHVSPNENDENWDALIRNLDKCSVSCPGMPPDRVLDLSRRQSLSGIVVGYTEMPTAPQDIVRILESSLQFASLSIADKQLRKELFFLFPGWIYVSEDFKGVRPKDFVAKAKALDWVYGSNGEDEITDIWLPSATLVADYPKQLSKLKTLRLDTDGIAGRTDVVFDTDVSPLKSLANLERLYFNRGQVLDSLAFLSGMSKLEHIQVSAQARAVLSGSSGYAVCTNLLSMRLYGTMDPITVTELSKLPKLKRIEIVDDDQTYQDATELAKLRKQLPAVEIIIIDPNTVKPDVSEKWKQHVANIRAKLIDRLNSQ